MERGLREAPLAQPEIALAGQQTFAEHVAVRAQHSALRVFAGVSDQHFFDQIGMIDENCSEVQHAQAGDVTVFTSDFCEVFQRTIV